MLKFSRISVLLPLCLLVCGLIPAIAQNTVLTTSSVLPGGGTGTNNVVIGPNNIYPSANNADRNVFIGGLAGFSNTTGDENLFIGHQAGYFNTSGSPNSFMGHQAGLLNSTGNYNSFIGYQAGFSNTIGRYNSFVGHQAGYSNIDGLTNSFLGYQAGYGNTMGSENVFVGFRSGFKNTTGHVNVFIGLEAGKENTTGADNVFIGFGTGFSNITGEYNTFVGVRADATGPNKSSLKYATAIGYGSKVSVENGLVLGVGNTLVGIGTDAPGPDRLTVCGDIGHSGNFNFKLCENSMRLMNRPFLHFNEHESLALGLGSEIPSGAEKTLVLGSKETTVQIPGILNSYLPHAGQFLTVDDQGNLLLSQPRVQVAHVADWSDKVFEPGYALRPLGEVEEFVKKNRHLPGVPSAAEMVAEGMESGAFNAKLLEKIEELTLYVVELEKRLKAVEK